MDEIKKWGSFDRDKNKVPFVHDNPTFNVWLQWSILKTEWNIPPTIKQFLCPLRTELHTLATNGKKKFELESYFEASGKLSFKWVATGILST